MEVFPVAGKDSMELNLSGAHAPYFTRNVVILTDSEGRTGVGEVPGGQKITSALEEIKPLVEGTRVGDYRNTILAAGRYLSRKNEKDIRGTQTFDLRVGVHVLTAVQTPLRAGGIAAWGRSAEGKRADARISFLYRRPQKDGPAL